MDNIRLFRKLYPPSTQKNPRDLARVSTECDRVADPDTRFSGPPLIAQKNGGPCSRRDARRFVCRFTVLHQEGGSAERNTICAGPKHRILDYRRTRHFDVRHRPPMRRRLLRSLSVANSEEMRTLGRARICGRLIDKLARRVPTINGFRPGKN